MNIGGQWDFGFAKLMGQYTRSSSTTSAFGTADGKGWLIGGLVPVGAGEIRLAYSQSSSTSRLAAAREVEKLAIGYVHNLSKRTAVYTTYAHLKNSGGANFSAERCRWRCQRRRRTVCDLGIRHSF